MTRHLLGSYLRFLRPILPAAILMFGLGLAHLDPAQAAVTRFVATTGNNAGNCPANSPCKTITYALGVANAGDTISVAIGTYNPALGEVFPLTINTNLTVTGAGAASTIIDATGASPSQRVITIISGISGTVTISGVTITGGISLQYGPGYSGPGGGGGIRNDGTLTLDNSIVTGNGGGGGVANFGAMTLNNSTVSNNKDAAGIGNVKTLTLNNSTVSGNNGGNGVGGIYNFGGSLTLTNSTVDGNTAGGEAGIRNSMGTMSLKNSTVSNNIATGNIVGGILNDCASTSAPATATLTNSTVSGNRAVAYGGGIVNLNGKGCSATITLSNSTVSNNTSGTGGFNGDGGGIMQDPRNTSQPSTITLKNSIVAGNISLTNNNLADCAGVITTQGHNLFGVNTGCPTTTVTDMTATNPGLGPLASNGGPTLTQALLLGSPAIDGVPLANCTDANNAPIAADQRGVARPQAAACDVGSVEFKTQMFEYAVKFVCGGIAGNGSRLAPVAPGFYFTAINVHNPNDGPINFTKKFARALTQQKAGAVSQFFPAALRSDEAFEVECGEITNKLQLAPLTFVTGFAVFQSVQELDIVAVYTAAANVSGPVVTMHTERVPKRP